MPRRTAQQLLILALLCSLTFAQQQDAIAFLHVHVVPMDRERILDDQTVVIRNGRIAAIGPTRTVTLPVRTQKIDATGRYLVPGLTDSHVHLYSTIEFRLYLSNGVTTVFNLDGRPAHLLWRNQIAAGELLGPTIFTAGPLFGRPHTPEETVRLVDEQADAGYDAVKIYNPVSKAEYPALIAEAKRRHLLLMGHIARDPGFELTIRSGQSLAHLDEVLYTYFNPQQDDNNDHIVLDESKIPVLAKETAEAGIYVIPTLSTYATTVQQATDLDAFLKHPELRYLSPWALEAFQPAVNRFKAGTTPEQYPRLRAFMAFQRKLARALFEDGVPLLAGTDAPDVGPMAGFGLHDELQELVNDGLTPFQALQTATVNPARYFQKSSEFGTVEAGKRADLVLLDANPLADISNTRAIAGVMVRGKWLAKDELAVSLAKTPGAYQRELKEVELKLAERPLDAEQYLADRDPLRTLGIAALSDLFRSQGASRFHQFAIKTRQAEPKSRLFSEAGINTLGYALMGEGKSSEAIALLHMNTEDFPASPNTFDSLAEVLAKSGDVSHACEAYAKALAIDAHYPNAEFAQKFLAEHAAK